MKQLKGFKQVRIETYQAAVSAGTAADYLWLVREFSGDTPISAAIYYGDRKYAELNNDEDVAKVSNVISSLGDMVDENGEWAGFLPTHEILGDETVESTADALVALENAILNNTALISGKVSVEDYEAAMEAVESAITANEGAIAELAEELNLKANKDDVYTKEEMDAKIAGAFHFKGVASGISEDGTTIYGEDAGDGIVASEDNLGNVYQIEDKEYASNGSTWVELGFNFDLTPILNKIAELEAAIEKERKEREALAEDLADLSEKVDELDDALSAGLEKVAAIENKVGDVELGDSVTQILYNLITVEGDDF